MYLFIGFVSAALYRFLSNEPAKPKKSLSKNGMSQSLPETIFLNDGNHETKAPVNKAEYPHDPAELSSWPGFEINSHYFYENEKKTKIILVQNSSFTHSIVNIEIDAGSFYNPVKIPGLSNMARIFFLSKCDWYWENNGYLNFDVPEPPSPLFNGYRDIKSTVIQARVKNEYLESLVANITKALELIHSNNFEIDESDQELIDKVKSQFLNDKINGITSNNEFVMWNVFLDVIDRQFPNSKDLSTSHTEMPNYFSQAIKKFLVQHYRPERMKITIVSGHSLETLEKIASMFETVEYKTENSKIPVKTTEGTSDNFNFLPHFSGKIIKYESASENRVIDILIRNITRFEIMQFKIIDFLEANMKSKLKIQSEKNHVKNFKVDYIYSGNFMVIHIRIYLKEDFDEEEEAITEKRGIRKRLFKPKKYEEKSFNEQVKETISQIKEILKKLKVSDDYFELTYDLKVEKKRESRKNEIEALKFFASQLDKYPKKELDYLESEFRFDKSSRSIIRNLIEEIKNQNNWMIFIPSKNTDELDNTTLDSQFLYKISNEDLEKITLDSILKEDKKERRSIIRRIYSH